MQNIKHILTEIEKKKNIKIRYACETGSSAWGIPLYLFYQSKK